ncbi:PLP-dependent aminotransferase family protein [Halomicronema hongdechloris C2206]|uniref:PLP-dependent aminotransferase family protein n=1 Tax=Halomicronema hongdechloris C2206 TaxID=1641165 RepID=A0A1Z3HU48_9CYAN|nr:GntR family transcriptional regulator [Halomicronema hongdechloris]ASC73792.1 PLP-dependent aminotransferase family protein [Halomicronema hongdechloris C2206]
MVQFHIQPDSDIPASTQLYDQIWFAIASRQYPPGYRLPSTRQLAMQTGLHRNTISKVYRQLEEAGVVEAHPGSGIYVRESNVESARLASPLWEEFPNARSTVEASLDELLRQGCSLHQARELFLAEIDWRLRCSAQVLVTTMRQDMGAGELMTRELEAALNIPVQLVPLEELEDVLAQTRSGTVVTSRYFITEAEAIAAPKSVRVIPIDIYNYAKELEMLKDLPSGTSLGMVSLSTGILRAAEVIAYSLKGDDILLMTAQAEDAVKLNALVRNSQTIVVFDQASLPALKRAIASARDDLIRPPQLVVCGNYIDADSITLLKRELGLD